MGEIKKGLGFDLLQVLLSFGPNYVMVWFEITWKCLHEDFVKVVVKEVNNSIGTLHMIYLSSDVNFECCSS